MSNENIFLGFTDEQLKLKASPEKMNRGRSPWLYWTSELYSVGRLYRKIAYYPSFLPLFIYSDHGINHNAELALHERENDSNVHLTFNPERALNPINMNKQIYLVPHPWIEYRKRKNYVPSPEAKGTLVFISHSTNNVKYIDKDRNKYFEELQNLSEKYKPLVLCMHMNDIKNNFHLDYRKYNLPIITIGNTSSINFVDEFYKITTKFKYATSNTSGSQLFYCVEMGIPYFIFGDAPDLVNYSDPNLPLGIFKSTNKTSIELKEIEQKLFRLRVDNVSMEQKIFSEWVLGMTSKTSRYNMALIIWRELFRNVDKVFILLFKAFGSKVKRKYLSLKDKIVTMVN